MIRMNMFFSARDVYKKFYIGYLEGNKATYLKDLDRKARMHKLKKNVVWGSAIVLTFLIGYLSPLKIVPLFIAYIILSGYLSILTFRGR